MILKVWAVHGDGGERGIGPVVGVYSSEKLARGASKGIAFYGSDGHVSERHVITDNDHCYLIDSRIDFKFMLDNKLEFGKEQAIKKALAKLTTNERELLGLE